MHSGREILKIITALIILLVTRFAPAQAVDDAADTGKNRGIDLVITDAGIERMKWNVENVDWAAEYFEQIKADVDEWRDKELDIPKRGGGWSHNYISPESGRRLQYDRNSPHRHLEPLTGKYFEGPLLDGAWREITHKQNMNLALEAALLFRLTGDRWYAGFARSVLIRYARAYHTYPPQGGPAGLGRVTAQALGEGVWLIAACSTYDLLDDTPALDEKDKKNIAKKLFIPAARHVEMYPFGIHNIQVWISVSMLMAGIISGDEGLADQAAEVLSDNIERGIRPEGMWYETSVGYHFYASHPFEILAAICRNRGLDVCDSSRLESMFIVMTHIAMPDGTMPATNDGGPGYRIGSNLRPLVAARYAFGDKSLDPAIAALFEMSGEKVKDPEVFMYMEPAGEEERWEPPSESVHMPGTGITVLRRGGQYALLKYNPVSGGHDHADRLGLIYYAGGRELYPDRGTTAYGHPLYRSWYKKTEAHNTIMVDGRQQFKQECRALDFTDGEDFAAVAAACDGLYDGVEASRFIVLTESSLIDVTRVESGEEHTYDWIIHANSPVPENIEPGGYDSPNQEIVFTSMKEPGDLYTVTWPALGKEDKEMRLVMAADKGDEVFEGIAIGFYPDEKMRVLMWREKGESATFASVTTAAGQAPPVLTKSGDKIEVDAGGKTVTIDTSTGKID